MTPKSSAVFNYVTSASSPDKASKGGLRALRALAPEIIARAQAEYDGWNQEHSEHGDPELGFGGICDRIADEIASVICDAEGLDGYVAVTQHNPDLYGGHTSVIVRAPDGVYNIDIPPYVYETGFAFTWKKIPDVVFDEGDVVVTRLSSRPKDMAQFVDDWDDDDES